MDGVAGRLPYGALTDTAENILENRLGGEGGGGGARVTEVVTTITLKLNLTS